jgi:integrase
LRGGRTHGPGGLAPRTVRYLHQILRAALADAVRRGDLQANPALAADPPTARAARARVFRTWSPEELSRFLESAKDDRFYTAFRLAAMTGMRRSEVLGVRRCDVDLERAELHVVQTIVEVAHVPQVSQPKTDHGRRTIALDTTTTAILREHCAAQIARGRVSSATSEDLLFQEDGKPIHPAVFSYAFVRRVWLAGVPRIRLHDLRHGHASHALRVGVHPKVVSERLGHSTVALTLDVYSHVVPTLQREAADAIAALVDS